MEELSLSKIKSPSGALGEIERVTVATTNQLPVSTWLNVELVDTLLDYHPVSVRKVSRHYEVVSGFRAFHAVTTLLDREDVVRVRVTGARDIDLVRGALFELITHSLMHCPESVEARQRVYRQIQKISATLRKEHGIKVPEMISARDLKTLLGLEGRHITSSRRRKSELKRIMESQ
jgi:hypothetical protein